jgi:ATP-binding protein involved in chromosome partitioning
VGREISTSLLRTQDSGLNTQDKNMITKEKILEALSLVPEPDLKKYIVELGLVAKIKSEENKISFTVYIHNPAMHNRKRMEEACANAIEKFFGKDVKVDINIEALPPENTRKPEHRTILKGVKNIVAIASGKGGVGKSTVSSNLAAALAMQGYKVGLVDADIYGPSLPLMFDVVHRRPKVENINGESKILPIESYGVKLLSIGFFAEVNQAVLWRGPMAVKALNQMFIDAEWGELDYMLIDLPPGTGDIHLSIVQLLPLAGVVIVTTPQAIALADAKKGAAMFQLPQINVPVIGIIENMAYFTPAELPQNKYYIFGKEGGKMMAETMGTPFLGEIPLVQSICEAGDAGRPAVLQETTPQALAFKEITNNFTEELSKLNAKFATVY